MSDSEDIDPAEHALSMDELMTWLMKDLKAWCSSHGLAVSAKRKEILAKRVYIAMHYENSSSSNDESVLCNTGKTYFNTQNHHLKAPVEATPNKSVSCRPD